MLETIWFLLWGLLWAIYFVLGGFDLGLGTMMPFVAGRESERAGVINAMGPFWDGNEVWLITAGGVTFAAFPKAYAVMFSSMYSALFILLFALILRGVAFEFRHQVKNAAWKRVWDWGIVIGSFLPALLLGVAFANIFKGIPIDGDGVLQGNLLSFLNPYALLGGVTFVFMFCLHGVIWLGIRSEGVLQQRSRDFGVLLWPLVVLFVLLFVVYTGLATNILANYLEQPLLFIILALPVGGILTSRVFIGLSQWWRAFAAQGATIAGLALFAVVGLHPALLPSSLDPAYSVTVEKAASTTLTLSIMLGVVLVFVPIVIAYTFWAYWHFSGKLTDEDYAS